MRSTSTLQQQARALGDPTRHEMFQFLGASEEPVGIAALAERFAIHHNAIRQHLAKLVDAGLVIETTAQPGGRGRPPLLYSVHPGIEGKWGTTGPYERLSGWLAEMITTGQSADEVGRRAGAAMRLREPSGDAVAHTSTALARQGFAPFVRRSRDRVEIVMRNCPFAAVASEARPTVCALHLGLAEGLVEGTSLTIEELVGNDPWHADCELRVLEAPAHQEPSREVARLTLRGHGNMASDDA